VRATPNPALLTSPGVLRDCTRLLGHNVGRRLGDYLEKEGKKEKEKQRFPNSQLAQRKQFPAPRTRELGEGRKENKRQLKRCGRHSDVTFQAWTEIDDRHCKSRLELMHKEANSRCEFPSTFLVERH
jgi:hypothetical protein